MAPIVWRVLVHQLRSSSSAATHDGMTSCGASNLVPETIAVLARRFTCAQSCLQSATMARKGLSRPAPQTRRVICRHALCRSCVRGTTSAAAFPSFCPIPLPERVRARHVPGTSLAGEPNHQTNTSYTGVGGRQKKRDFQVFPRFSSCSVARS